MGKEEENPYVQQVKAYAAKHNAGTIVVCAKTEEELSEMDEDGPGDVPCRLRPQRERA